MDVIYTNQNISSEEWHKFEVGKSHFNDEALRHAGRCHLKQVQLTINLPFLGETVIQDMREKRPAYNLISNNCQNFALLLLDAIKVGQIRQFGSTSSVYQKLVGPGAVKDLFQDDATPVQTDPAMGEMPPLQHADTVSVAAQVMEDNTTKLDTHEQHKHHGFFS
jgi:hypothetical protein